MVEVDDLASNLKSSKSDLLVLQILLDTDTTIAAKCGLDEDEFSNIQLAVHDTEDAFKEFVEIVGGAQDALDCERINGIFVDLGHEAICGSASSTLLWIYCTMSIVFALGMFIILLRGALLPPVPISGAYGNVHSYDQEDALSEPK